MAKKKQRQAKDNYQVSTRFNAPEVVDMDTIGVMSDDEIGDRAQELSTTRYNVIEAGADPYLWEIELCYLQREFQLRRGRKDAHELFLKDQARPFEDESDLPLPEFDNHRYAAVN